MDAFTKIVVHYDDPTFGELCAVIRPRAGMEALFLEGSEVRLAPEATGKKRHGRPKRVTVERAGGQRLTDQEMTLASGPEEVCYLENGQLICWDPD